MPPSRKTVPRPKSFNCPKCAGVVKLRYPERAMSVVCPNCQSILDTSTPQVKLLQEYNKKITVKPRIPLGTRATLRGVQSEVIGFMRRSGSSEGYSFSWVEYLLYNPYTGYRFLAENQQGWALMSMTNEIAPPPTECYRGVVVQGKKYAYVEAYTAKVDFVLGEFYWRVEVGEKVRCFDFKTGDALVMAEVMPEEYIWSAGTKLPPAEVWQAFKIPGEPPEYSEEEEESGNLSPTAIVIILIVVVVIIIVFALSESGGSGTGFFLGGK